ncbi:hypothetical protein KKE26_05255 [bacterium]|nr:hypothetical protein [bacterium]MBU1754228.1 hypothetical protein [bacterium]
MKKVWSLLLIVTIGIVLTACNSVKHNSNSSIAQNEASKPSTEIKVASSSQTVESGTQNLTSANYELGQLSKKYETCGDDPDRITSESEPSPSLQNIILFIPSLPDKEDEKDVIKRTPVELTGTIEFGHDVAGGKYDLVSGKECYTIRYIWNLTDTAQDIISRLDEAKTRVIVKGTLKIWNDGGSMFDNSAPVFIYQNHEASD